MLKLAANALLPQRRLLRERLFSVAQAAVVSTGAPPWSPELDVHKRRNKEMRLLRRIAKTEAALGLVDGADPLVEFERAGASSVAAPSSLLEFSAEDASVRLLRLYQELGRPGQGGGAASELGMNPAQLLSRVQRLWFP